LTSKIVNGLSKVFCASRFSDVAFGLVLGAQHCLHVSLLNSLCKDKRFVSGFEVFSYPLDLVMKPPRQHPGANGKSWSPAGI
jgi:hypothetical protein